MTKIEAPSHIKTDFPHHNKHTACLIQEHKSRPCWQRESHGTRQQSVCAASVHSVCMLIQAGHAAAKAESNGTQSLSLSPYTLSTAALSAGSNHQNWKLTPLAHCLLHQRDMPCTEGFYRGLEWTPSYVLNAFRFSN